MKKDGFAKRLEIALEHAQELAGLWTNTPIAEKLNIEIEALKQGVEDGDIDGVTNELFPQLIETINFANAELQRTEG